MTNHTNHPSHQSPLAAPDRRRSPRRDIEMDEHLIAKLYGEETRDDTTRTVIDISARGCLADGLSPATIAPGGSVDLEFQGVGASLFGSFRLVRSTSGADTWQKRWVAELVSPLPARCTGCRIWSSPTGDLSSPIIRGCPRRDGPTRRHPLEPEVSDASQ